MRKESISVESEDAKDLLKSLTQNLPMDSDLMKLLAQTLKLDERTNGKPKKDKGKTKKKQREDPKPFNPQRFPSFFRRHAKGDAEKPVAVPLGGGRAILFDTDVEDHYFDRIEDPGELQLAILGFNTNNTRGGNAPGKVDKIENMLNISISSPQQGTIKLHLNPKETAHVGDAARIQASLSDPSGEFEAEAFWVKISEPKAPPENTKKTEEIDIPNLGLPELILTHQEQKDNSVTWEQVQDATSKTIDHSTVMYPMVDGEKLEKIYVNMDSTVFMNFKPKNPNEEQLELATRKYIASVYFHTLFLYTITKNRKYKFMQETDTGESDVELDDYLIDLFESHYAAFILNFGADAMMQVVEE